MMQPVYLNAPGVRRVTLEGPALRIHFKDRADRYLPLQRLGRIVCRGPVQWSTAALLQCLGSGIPIVFLNREGREIGLCCSAWPRHSPLSELLDGFFASDEGPRRLVDWFHSHSRVRLLILLRRHRLQPPDLRVRTVRQHLRRTWRERHPDTEAPVASLKPLLKAQVAEVLAGYRIGPALMEPGHDWAGMPAYLSGVLEWDLWNLALAGRIGGIGPGYRDRVAAYQRHAGWLEGRARDLIAKLWRWLEHDEAYTP